MKEFSFSLEGSKERGENCVSEIDFLVGKHAFHSGHIQTTSFNILSYSKKYVFMPYFHALLSHRFGSVNEKLFRKFSVIASSSKFINQKFSSTFKHWGL